MTKKAIIAHLRSEASLTEVEANKSFDAVFSAVKTVLLQDHEARVPGFGTFKVKFREGREGRNPSTGEPITIQGKNVIAFKASADLI